MKKIADIIGDAKTIGISGHMRPDGDCIGSCMAVYNYIVNNHPNVEVKVYLEYVDEKFKLLKNTDKIITTGYDGTVFDLFFALDSADMDRLNTNKEFFLNAKRTACVDHHISNKGYADFNYILPHASSACEVIYDLMEDELIDQSVAEALYLGIAHDSGCFRYQSTSPRTMIIAAKLMEKGVDITTILEKTYYMKTFAQQQITANILSQAKRMMDNRCICSYATKKMMDDFGVNTNDLDAVVSELRDVEGIECAIFMYEVGENEYKVSLRSNTDIDVSVIAVKFGGGGHVRAAGFNICGEIDENIDRITKELELQM